MLDSLWPPRWPCPIAAPPALLLALCALVTISGCTGDDAEGGDSDTGDTRGTATGNDAGSDTGSDTGSDASVDDTGTAGNVTDSGTTGGMTDSGTGGATDTTMTGTDTGATDTGTTDAGTTDTGTTDTGTTGAASGPAGTIVPLYTYPTDATWATVAQAKVDHPTLGIVAIVNPSSGPGVAVDLNYDTGITALQDAGVVVIGYVYTAYAARPVADVQADIAAYLDFYPQIDGLMFDEMSNVPGNEDYYDGLSLYAAGLGLDFTVGNPGVGVPESFVDTVDTMFVYENVGLPDPDSLGGWSDGYDRDNFAIIPHSVPAMDATFVSAALDHVGWIYITDDGLPNPWDTLPPYFESLLDALDAG